MRSPALQLNTPWRHGRRSLARTATSVALCLAVLAACAEGGSTISRNRLYGRYDVTEVQWGAGGGRDFAVVVRNNPTAMPDAEFEKTVINAIQGQITYMITNFTTTPGETARGQYRVEFFFDPPETTNGFALCNPERELAEPVARPGETFVLGPFCLRDAPLSEAFGRRAGAAPGTPEFDRLMSQLIRSLLPQVHRGRRSPRCRPPMIC